MIEIKIYKNSHDYDAFIITTEEGQFEISFQNNLDLYWRYLHKDMILEEPEIKEFTITKENYYLYTLFDNLYNAIKNSNPYSGYTFLTPKSFYLKNEDYEEEPEQEIYVPENPHPNNLYKNGIITWCSDDFSSMEKASNFQLKKDEDVFKITFKKSEREPESGNPFITYSVRIRNSGSRYTPYNIAFMKMYQDLKEYNPKHHQIHIEEYLYEQKKLAKIKN